MAPRLRFLVSTHADWDAVQAQVGEFLDSFTKVALLTNHESIQADGSLVMGGLPTFGLLLQFQGYAAPAAHVCLSGVRSVDYQDDQDASPGSMELLDHGFRSFVFGNWRIEAQLCFVEVLDESFRGDGPFAGWSRGLDACYDALVGTADVVES